VCLDLLGLQTMCCWTGTNICWINSTVFWSQPQVSLDSSLVPMEWRAEITWGCLTRCHSVHAPLSVWCHLWCHPSCNRHPPHGQLSIPLQKSSPPRQKRASSTFKTECAFFTNHLTNHWLEEQTCHDPSCPRAPDTSHA